MNSPINGQDHAGQGAGYIPAEPVHVGRGRALVMDDNESIRSVAEAMLQRMGYETFTAKDGAEALELLKANPCGLVLLDLMIPGGMGGVDTAQEIRKAYGNSVTILAISGHGDAQAIAEPHKFGFDAGISKPFTKADLIRGLGKAARHHL